MELKFDSLEELEKFIVEELGYIKKNGIKEEKENENNPITLTIKECPYGFLYCPYNKKIDPYTQTYPLYCKQNSTTNVQNNDSNISVQNAVNIKDLSKENDT